MVKITDLLGNSEAICRCTKRLAGAGDKKMDCIDFVAEQKTRVRVPRSGETGETCVEIV